MVADDQRLREIYELYSGLIYAYATRRTGAAADAADAVAETFLVAWRRIDVVPAGDETRPWLFGVVRRVLANERRGRRRRERAHAKVAGDQLPTADVVESSSDATRRARIVAAFGCLRETDREVLGLLYWDGLSRHEVAAVLGCSTTTLRVKLHRARTRFRRELDKAFAEQGAAHEAAPERAVQPSRKDN